MKVVRVRPDVTPSIEILSAFGISITFVYAYRSGVHQGSFLAILAALFISYDPLKRLGAVNNQLKQGAASLIRLEEILHEPEMITDPDDPVKVGRLRGEIAFNRVTFAYKENVNVLRNVNVRLPAGTVCALVGPSGAGKTTFANLVPRFYEVNQGGITIDGIDLRNMRFSDLRRNIALVSQDPVLFNETLYHNLLLGLPDATREEVMTAAINANAHDFITAFPQGYDTMAGERGSRLSGGQKQRMAVARAFLRNAPILILDEATSALDSDSEAAIQAALKKLMVGKTVLIIAHRFSTIRDASIDPGLRPGGDRGDRRPWRALHEQHPLPFPLRPAAQPARDERRPARLMPPPPSPVTPAEICAVVVTYHPDASAYECIRAILAEAAHTVIVANSAESPTRALRAAAVTVVENPENVGVAAALNQGVRTARGLGFRWVLFFDQDTKLLPGRDRRIDGRPERRPGGIRGPARAPRHEFLPRPRRWLDRGGRRPLRPRAALDRARHGHHLRHRPRPRGLRRPGAVRGGVFHRPCGPRVPPAGPAPRLRDADSPAPGRASPRDVARLREGRRAARHPPCILRNYSPLRRVLPGPESPGSSLGAAAARSSGLLLACPQKLARREAVRALKYEPQRLRKLAAVLLARSHRLPGHRPEIRRPASARPGAAPALSSRHAQSPASSSRPTYMRPAPRRSSRSSRRISRTLN